MDVHEKIKVMRLFKDLTQEEMAEKLGYASIQGYAKLERGETDPSIGKLEEIARVLGISLQDLLGLNESNVVNVAGNCQYIRHNSSPNVTLTLLTETQCANELEQTRLLLQERDKEIEHFKAENGLLRDVVELMKIQQKPQE
ncbi:MAG: helix-turn-helix transcriptional regulator [Methylococcales bacterium]|nr:helix-turn-helix transcriptional regulator [Methylococcales bacterium]MDP3838730.1 helix-turn-helix transcriptional regulator [Methylococcales bacterium]